MHKARMNQNKCHSFTALTSGACASNAWMFDTVVEAMASSASFVKNAECGETARQRQATVRAVSQPRTENIGQGC